MNRWRWVMGSAGVAAMGWAAWLTLTGGAATDPWSVATWLVGGLVLHDAVLAPVVLGLGWLTARALPDWVRAPVQVGGLVSATLTLASVPLLLGRGRASDNPSVDPLDYGRNVIGLVLVVAVVCTLWAVSRRRRETSGPQHDEAPPA